MQSPPLPDVGSLHQQLSTEASRVTRFIESLPSHVDHLLAAASADDWQDVKLQSEYLANAGQACELQALSQAAADVQQAIAADNTLLARKNVVKLISRCGTIKLPQREEK